MGPKEFVVAKMKELVKEFDSVRTSYSFHKLSDTHSVEVIPNDLYHNNEDFRNWEVDFVYEFMNLFPNDSICVLTDNSIIAIENVEFFFEGDKFNNYTDCVINSELKILEPLESIFDTHEPQIHDEFTFNQILVDVNSLPNIFNKDFKMTSFLNNNSIMPTRVKDGLIDEDNYSFAA